MALEILNEPRIRAIGISGAPIPLAKLYCYAAGSSSTLQDTYTTSVGNVANANPVVADSAGLFGPIYLLPLAYNFVLKSSDGGTTYWSQDNVAGPNYAALVDTSWELKDGADPTKILKFELSSITTATTRTLTIPNASDTIAVLALAQTLAAKTLTGCAGLAMTLGVIQAARGSDITAANDITLPTNGNFFAVTGATQINRLTAAFQHGTEITLWFQSTPTVKHNQGAGSGFYPVLLNGAVDFVAAANTVIKLVCINANSWIEVPRRS